MQLRILFFVLIILISVSKGAGSVEKNKGKVILLSHDI